MHHLHGTFQKMKLLTIMKQAMKRSERYRTLKKAGMSMEQIEKNFNTPVAMTVFTWKGSKDTLMSPKDSIRYYKAFLQSGFMSMEPQTGYIKAWVGGINHKFFQYDHVQIGHARQVGSTFKPFVYALAIQEGYSPCYRLPNVPTTISYDGKEWTPSNSDDKLNGKMLTMQQALANSVNYISAYFMKQFGPQATVDLVRRMGIVSPIEAVPAICLGTPEISVFEMVGANATFANQGVWIEPTFVTRIEDKNGKVLADFVPKTEEVMSEEKAYIMIQLMKGVVDKSRYRSSFALSLIN
jgi:penicillin-binding protein 1A